MLPQRKIPRRLHHQNQNQNQDRGVVEQPKPSLFKHWLSHMGQIIALLALVFSLLGYGVIMGIASTFRFDHTVLISGPFDLLMNTWQGLMIFIKIVFSESSLGIIRKLYSAYFWPLTIAIALTLCLTLTEVTGNGIFRRKYSNIERKVKSWVIFKYRRPVVLIFFIVATPLVMVVGIVGAAILVIMLPLYGYFTGQAYAHEFIRAPYQCAVGRKIERDETDHIKGYFPSEQESTVATCVKVISKDPIKPFSALGRLVLSSYNYVLLYDPETGVTSRIPIADMIVSTLPDPSVHQKPPLDTPEGEIQNPKSN